METADASARNRAILLAAYQRYIAGGPEGIYDLLSPDILWSSGGPELPWGGTHRGLEGVRAYFAALFARVEIVSCVLERILAEGEWLVVIATVHLRFRATGIEHRVRKADVVRMQDGRVQEYQEFYDTAAVLAALEAGAPQQA